jgi:hypothetical protein
MRLATASVLAIAILGCVPSRPSPLSGMSAPTRATVTAGHGWQVRDSIVSSAALDSLLAAASGPARWKVPDFTPPAGDLAVLLWADTIVIGVVRVGPNFLMVSSQHTGDGEQRHRPLDAQERKRIEAWLGATPVSE